MKKIVLSIIIFLLFIGNAYAKEEIEVTLNKCVDGDTANFNYQNEVIKARFLAIDTPEIKHGNVEAEPYGEVASNFTCDKLKAAKKIVLEYDDGSDKLDKYNRHLVWIFVDDKLLQSEIIKKGYAEVAYLYGNYKYTESLQEDEEYAKTQKVGIWDEETNRIVDIIMKAITIIVFIFTLYRLIKKELKKKKII